MWRQTKSNYIDGRYLIIKDIPCIEDCNKKTKVAGNIHSCNKLSYAVSIEMCQDCNSEKNTIMIKE